MIAALRGQAGRYTRVMRWSFGRLHRTLPPALGASSLAGAALLLATDLLPISRHRHDVLAALPLALIAVAYLVHQSVLRPAPKELLKTLMIAAAFLAWAASLVWPDPVLAALFGDAAVVLFVVDVFLVIVGWPPTPPDEAFAETSRDLDRLVRDEHAADARHWQ
jgi:hypothetical protein